MRHVNKTRGTAESPPGQVGVYCLCLWIHTGKLQTLNTATLTLSLRSARDAHNSFCKSYFCPAPCRSMHSDSTMFSINTASCIMSAHVYIELNFFSFHLGSFSPAVHFDLKVTSLPDKNECGNVFPKQSLEARLSETRRGSGSSAAAHSELASCSHGLGSLMNDERCPAQNTAPTAHIISPVYVTSC